MQELDIGYISGVPFQDEDGQWRINVFLQENMQTGEPEDLIEAFLCLPYGVLNAPPEGTTALIFIINNTNAYAMPIDADEYMKSLAKNSNRVGNLKDSIYLDFTTEKILLMHKNTNILDNLNERDIDIKNGFTNAREALSVIQTAFTSISNATGGTSTEVGLIKAAAGIAASSLQAYITAIQGVETSIQQKYNEIDNLITE